MQNAHSNADNRSGEQCDKGRNQLALTRLFLSLFFLPLFPLALGKIQPSGPNSSLSSSEASSGIWNVQEPENLLSSTLCQLAGLQEAQAVLP